MLSDKFWDLPCNSMLKPGDLVNAGYLASRQIVRGGLVTSVTEEIGPHEETSVQVLFEGQLYYFTIEEDYIEVIEND
tara:strand:+ start:308 stop:538 length:231 start_codon:yes stop_codon:yes gene_type:complete